jgi:hypothetical protein
MSTLEERQNDIRLQRQQIMNALADAEEARGIALVKLHGLQRRCSHPNARSISHQGEACTYCPDCGEDY